MAYGIDLWKIVLESDCSEEIKIQIRIGLDDLNAKAKAFDEIRGIEKTSDVTGYHEDTESYMYDVESVIEKYDTEDE